MMNEREMDVLSILWETEKALMATDIVNVRQDLTQSTVTAVLRKLLRKGLVEVAGVTQSGKVLSRTYRPTEASKKAVLDSLVEEYRNIKSVVTLEEINAAIKTAEEADKAQ